MTTLASWSGILVLWSDTVLAAARRILSSAIPRETGFLISAPMETFAKAFRVMSLSAPFQGQNCNL